MTSQALVFTLAALGISETVYLIKKRRLSQAPVCPVGDSCQIVLSSKYRTTLGISNDLLGLLFYISASLIASFIVIGIGPLPWLAAALKVMVAVGSLLSLWFVWLQAKIIKAWCFWCLMSALTIWCMGVTILLGNILIP